MLNSGWVVKYLLRFGVRWMASFLSSMDLLQSRIFEFYCTLFMRHPCEVYEPKDTAVLVIGADDGIGRDITMMLSELGYTVFALCPHRDESATFSRSFDVSSLLYAWHLNKERHSGHPWGLVAPISLDISSKSDRSRAHETIKVYCSTHLLSLGALVILPPVFEASRQASSCQLGASQNALIADHLRLPISLANQEVWEDIVTRELTEPVLAVQDYIDLLKRSSGRVIMVSGWVNAETGSSSPLDSSREIVAHALGKELEPLGVRVTSVITGPLSSSVHISPPREMDKHVPSKRHSLGTSETKGRLGQQPIREILKILAIPEKELFAVIKRILQSRYPRCNYVVGVYPYVQGILEIALQWYGYWDVIRYKWRRNTVSPGVES